MSHYPNGSVMTEKPILSQSQVIELVARLYKKAGIICASERKTHMLHVVHPVKQEEA